MRSNLETFVVSDMHLSEAGTPDPNRPLWMAYKRREFFIDDDFVAFLDFIETSARGPVELVLNGDIFDFDNILELPEESEHPIDRLSRLRGLPSEEWMSQFKMQVIIRDHPHWFEALGAFVRRGNRAVFVIGNHDVELYWPSVQRLVCDALGVPPPSTMREEGARNPDSIIPPAMSAEDDHSRLSTNDPVVFCEWFYISEDDTYISHGHQYDPNCTLKDPIDPLIEVHGRPRVRLPFGDLAARYMLNGMGYFNPHASENYIMTGTAYMRFFFRYMLRTQPFLPLTWFWGALTTFWVSLRTHWLHPMRDPLLVDEKVRSIAMRSKATPSIVRKLDALHVSSACNNPVRILRELWLDRAFLMLATVFIAWQVVLHINIAWPISPLWAFVPLAVLLLPYIAYASSVKPAVFDQPLLTERQAELIFKITNARRVVFGHTHRPEVVQVGPLTVYNGGFWSAAFSEPECINRIGAQTFVWIHPDKDGKERVAELYEWRGDETASDGVEVVHAAHPAVFRTERPIVNGR